MNLSDSRRDQGCQKTDPTGTIDFSPRNPDEIADPGFPKSTLALSLTLTLAQCIRMKWIPDTYCILSHALK